MTELMDLPWELLSVILTFLAMSGGRDLVRASATCRRLLRLARRPEILRVTNCENIELHGFGTPHYHMDGLLSRCVRAGNPIADLTLAMAMLLGGTKFFLDITRSQLLIQSIDRAVGMSLAKRHFIVERSKTGSIADLPFVLFCSEDDPHICESYGRLEPMRLLRSFLSQASSGQLLLFYCKWEEFVALLMGHNGVIWSDICLTIQKMCMYDLMVAEGNQMSLHPSFLRDKLLVEFDRLLSE